MNIKKEMILSFFLSFYGLFYIIVLICSKIILQ